MKSSVPSVEPRIVVKDSKVDFIQKYDVDNKYPQRVRDIIRASGTASNCTEKYAKFINGKGFKDLTFYKSKVNRKQQTVDSILRQTTSDFSEYRGFALHANFNALLQVNEVNFVPFENCRLGLASRSGYVPTIALYDDWACKKESKILKDNVAFIDRWNPDPEVLLAQITAAGGLENYKGQVMYFSLGGDDAYPLSIIDPVLEDVISDAGLKTFRYRNTTTAFLASHIIEYPQEFESEEDRESALESWKQFQGTNNANKMLVLEKKSADSLGVTVTKLEAADIDKMFNTTNTTCKSSIIERFGIPPILANMLVPGKLAASSEYRDAYQIYNSNTLDERKIFEEKFKEVFSRYRNPINPSGDYSIIPLSFDVATI